MDNSYSKRVRPSNSRNLRKEIFAVLDQEGRPDPLITPKTICQILNLPYKDYASYVAKTKTEWRYYPKNERGSCRSCPDEVHNAYFRGELPVEVVSRVKGVVGEILRRSNSVWCLGYPNPSMKGFGWTVARNRNSYLYYKSGLGSIKLFDNGTVLIFVRKPASNGKCMQLFCNALTKTFLIDSITLVEKFQKGLMRKFHATFKMGQRLPYVKITAFEDTHRFSFTSGDKSHPDCYEFMFEYSSEVESARAMFEQFGEMFREFSINRQLEGPKVPERLDSKPSDIPRGLYE